LAARTGEFRPDDSSYEFKDAGELEKKGEGKVETKEVKDRRRYDYYREGDHRAEGEQPLLRRGCCPREDYRRGYLPRTGSEKKPHFLKWRDA